MDPIRFGLSRVPFAQCYNKRVIFRANCLVPLTWLKNNVAYKSTNTLLLPTPNAEYYSTSKLSSPVNVSLNSLSQKASSGSKIYPFKNRFPLPFSRSILPIRSLAFLKLCVRHNSTVPSKDEQAQDISKINTNGTLQTPNKKVNVFRLFTLARGQGWNFFIAGSLLLVSSGVTMSIPYIVGKILDAGSSGDSSVTHIMGIPSGTFYIGLLGLFFLGSACNFGRIITLRLLSERIVSRLRARLFAKCMSLDGAFFDFHKHGDLISRLTTDSSIVGKSLSMYLSDGLRSSVSAIAGIGMMLYVSMRLTGYMSLIVPPIALGAFFYGEYVRKLSRTTQDALGDLTRVSEEKLANVRTTQAFLGERQEVNRYNDYIRNLFVLAKREAFASGIFFGSDRKSVV